MTMSTALFLFILLAAVAVRIWAGVAFTQWLDNEPEDVQRRMRQALARGVY